MGRGGKRQRKDGWTDAQEAILWKNYPTAMTLEAMSLLTGRSPRAIESHANKKMGLKRPSRQRATPEHKAEVDTALRRFGDAGRDRIGSRVGPGKRFTGRVLA